MNEMLTLCNVAGCVRMRRDQDECMSSWRAAAHQRAGSAASRRRRPYRGDVGHHANTGQL